MSAQSLVKQPGENRLYDMDFSPLLAEGETLSSCTVASTPVGLTLSGSATVSGSTASQRISGGTSGTRYKLTFTAVTSAGNTVEADGILQVRDL